MEIDGEGNPNVCPDLDRFIEQISSMGDSFLATTGAEHCWPRGAAPVATSNASILQEIPENSQRNIASTGARSGDNSDFEYC